MGGVMNVKTLSTSNSSCPKLLTIIATAAVFTTASVSAEQFDLSPDSYYHEYSYTSGSSTKNTSILKDERLAEEEVHGVVNCDDQIESDEMLAFSECPLFIKNTFGISVTDFAKVLNISRPTAYKYLDGEIPSTSNSVIESLYSLAQSWSTNTEGATLGMEFKRSYDGKSLYDSLIEGDYVQSKLQLEKITKVVNSRRERAQSYTKSKKKKRVNLDIIRQSVS